jgi:TLC domain
MCKNDTTTTTTADAVAGNRKSPPRLLLSLESYSSHDGSRSDKNTDQRPVQQHPPMASCLTTGLLFVAFLVCAEQLGRYILAQNQHWHPELLGNETNRQILARHLFVDTLSCAVVAALGWVSRDTYLYPVLAGTIPVAGYEQRLFTYSAPGFRVALVFFFYQVKNLVDTIMWGDGPEFIFHHIFSLITAWGAMSPGCGHMYALFFFGLSEISTAVLCVLANFDDEHGVPGLGEALPITKVVLGALFVFFFILCRCVLWPITSYYFCRDILQALKGSDPRAVYRRHWMKFFLVSLSGLSVLQVAWLGQIFILGKQELEKAGFL